MVAYIAGSAASNFDETFANTTIAVTLGAAVAVGDLIVLMAGATITGNSDLSSVTDSLGNIYTLQANRIGDAGQWGRTAFSKVTVAGTPDITATMTASVDTRRIIAAAYSGIGTTPADGTVGNAQAAPGTGVDAVTSGNITTTVAGDLIIGFHQNTAEFEPGTGVVSAGTDYTKRHDSGAILQVEDLVQAAAGAIAATWTLSIGHATITHICAFKAAVAEGLRMRALTGVGQ